MNSEYFKMGVKGVDVGTEIILGKKRKRYRITKIVDSSTFEVERIGFVGWLLKIWKRIVKIERGK